MLDPVLLPSFGTAVRPIAFLLPPPLCSRPTDVREQPLAQPSLHGQFLSLPMPEHVQVDGRQLHR